jgi:hypothetical protein
MDNPTQLPPESGWIAALVLTLGGLLKGAWPWLKGREAAQHRLTAEERKVQREEDRDLVATLKAELSLLKEEVKQLRDDRVADKVMVASLTAKLDHAEAEIIRVNARAAAEETRLRDERDHYRKIAEAGGHALADSRPDASRQILDEISEADEATSIPGGKP